ncbi:hypothetical protein KSP39_PZI000943 [Platanthera zijinensis]|uniref:Uncharacterized protein n=1 Tax=Platanthera zijinensis TaxID=2320716 RepID=A0AAP0C222_9ASPA
MAFSKLYKLRFKINWALATLRGIALQRDLKKLLVKRRPGPLFGPEGPSLPCLPRLSFSRVSASSLVARSVGWQTRIGFLSRSASINFNMSFWVCSPFFRLSLNSA